MRNSRNPKTAKISSFSLVHGGPRNQSMTTQKCTLAETNGSCISQKLITDSLMTVSDNNQSVSEQKMASERAEVRKSKPCGVLCLNEDEMPQEPPCFTKSLPTPEETLKHLSRCQAQVLSVC